jgi:enolase-phosphatase E1
VTLALRQRGIAAVLLDIEGTTTPIAFVYETLFPFARTYVREFLDEHLESDPVLAAVDRLHGEWLDDLARGESLPESPDGALGDEPESIATYVAWLMDRDRKSPGLKALQGLIWETGYRSGRLRGEVYADVPRALERWRREGIEVAIYSSGSVLAQRLLFGTTPAGDLTPLMTAFFDTAVGAKTAADSYRRIAGELRRPAAQILFVSDVAAELDAALAAGCQTALCVRPGNPAQPVRGSVPVVRSLDDLR